MSSTVSQLSLSVLFGLVFLFSFLLFVGSLVFLYLFSISFFLVRCRTSVFLFCFSLFFLFVVVVVLLVVLVVGVIVMLAEVVGGCGVGGVGGGGGG